MPRVKQESGFSVTRRDSFMKKVIIALLLFIAVTLVANAWLSGGTSSQSNSVVGTTKPIFTEVQPMSNHNHGAMARVPAYQSEAADLSALPPTLSPELFTGNIRLAYQAAKEIPETLAQLPCYCHCDKGHGHKSLHSCFESEHGENCGICIGEALMAYELQKREKLTPAEIRERVIEAYGTASNQ